MPTILFIWRVVRPLADMKISLCPVSASVLTLRIVRTRICRSKTTAAKAGGVKQPQPLKQAHETLHNSSEFRRSPRRSRCLRYACSFPFLGRARLPVRIRKCQRNRRRNLPLTAGILHHSPIAHQLTETLKEAPVILFQGPPPRRRDQPWKRAICSEFFYSSHFTARI